MTTKAKIFELLRGITTDEVYCNYFESMWTNVDNPSYSVTIFKLHGAVDAEFKTQSLKKLLKHVEIYCGIL